MGNNFDKEMLEVENEHGMLSNEEIENIVASKSYAKKDVLNRLAIELNKPLEDLKKELGIK